jgi:hypothetical protein
LQTSACQALRLVHAMLAEPPAGEQQAAADLVRLALQV